MEDTPKIVMQCPKCAMEFSPDTAYCETCSVMLEPVEIISQERGNESDHRNSSGTTLAGGKDERLDDVKIDSLKTDMEQTFVRTLLLELDQLKKRAMPGNHPVSQNEDADHQSGHGEGSRTEEIIEKRITKLETILRNLEKKIEEDISDIESRLGNLRKPGLFALITADGRIYRMLTSELKGKYSVLNTIRSKQPPPPLEILFRPFFVTIISTVILAAVAWTVFSVSLKKQTMPVTTPSPSPEYTVAGEDISRKDVINLLEDIKKANLNKDMSLWETRYSKSYPALREKKENIRKLWKNFNYTSLEYRIDRMNTLPAAASAQITWDIELRAKKTGKNIRSSEPLSADFIREDKTLKISAIRKKGR